MTPVWTMPLKYCSRNVEKTAAGLLQAKHPGQTHFDMEKAGQASRWNTLRALRVLKYSEIDI